MEVDSIADLWVIVSDEFDVEKGVADATLAAGFTVGSVGGSVPES